MTTIGPIQSEIELIQPFPLSDDAVHMQFGHNISIGQLTLEIYYFKMWMDDETTTMYERHQTPATPKPYWSYQIILAYNCRDDVLQVEEETLRLKIKLKAKIDQN